jgi:hypothetical protein
LTIHAYDPFDLPEWLGTRSVCFSTGTALPDTARVQGLLTSDAGESFALDLLAVDAAYPAIVCPDEHRRAAHQAWQFGQVAFVETDGRVAATVPGTRFDADRACEVIRRLAKSVGASADRFTVSVAL